MEKAKRYLVFLFGLFISSFGVSLITKENLGTSPISAIPYVLSLNFPFTLGQFTIAFSLFLILLQLLILRRNFKAEHLLQIPISVAFGYFIDLTMVMLGFVAPGSYPVKLVALLIGCVILAFGVYLEVVADVAMLPGESFVRAVTQTWKTDFGTTKVCFDVSMTVIAAKGSCVIVGRCADYLLRDDPHCLRVWLHADKARRVERIMELEQLDETAAKTRIAQEDRRRATNYQYYTRRVWGLGKNYHLTLDTGLGEEYVQTCIEAALKALEAGQKTTV